MKINKIIAGTLSLCLIGGAVPFSGAALPKAAITASAAEEDYTVGTYESLTYAKYADHVEITDCDESAEGEIKIPTEIEGVPVTGIGRAAFQGRKNLISITLPDSVTSIGAGAFYGSGLTSIEIPNSVVSIESAAFAFCYELSSIFIPESVKYFGAQVFGSTQWLENKQSESPLVIINGILIDGTTCVGDVLIPDNVTSIGERAFDHCEATSITISNSVTSIQEGAFYGCTNLTGITIPDSVTSIGDNAFGGCTNLTGITIPDSVIYIGAYAFGDCSSLTNITIPNSVTSIGNRTFYGCENLAELTILNPDCEIIQSKYSPTIPSETTIYGYANSTAQAYAEEYGNDFVSLGEAPTAVYGDANDNGEIEVADAVFILQGLADPSNEEFKRTTQGEINADCHNTGNGVDSEDALTILKFKAQLISELPC